jgi:outer membrane protein OmpA-like peptidoglycan-associated protein
MSPIVNVLIGAACLLALVTTGMLAQTEVPGETNNVDLHDPRNLPLALNADIRTLVGLSDGAKRESLSLEVDAKTLDKAMSDLRAQVNRTEIHVDMPGDVLFDFDKTDLKPKAQETLKKLTTIIRAKSKGKVQINGFGKTNPVASNTLLDGTDNPEGRARNRRVEVIIATQ